MHSAALVWHQVIQVRQPREKRLLAPPGMVEAFHHEQCPVNGVMGLIQQRAGHWHSGVFEHRVPARFLLLEPLSHALAIGCSSRDSDVIRKATSPLAQRKHPQTLPLSCPVEQRMELGAQGLADRRRDRGQSPRELVERVAQTIAEARPWKQRRRVEVRRAQL